MKITASYKDLVEKYYKPFTYNIEENAPKLTKQLTKADKEFTVDEVQAFQELLLAVFDNEKGEVLPLIFLNTCQPMMSRIIGHLMALVTPKVMLVNLQVRF